MQQAGTIDCLPESETACGENDDGPEEVIEIFFCQNPRPEEEHDRNDSNDSHIPKHAFELVAQAPENDSRDRDDGDEPLDPREAVSHWSDSDDGGVAARAEGREEEEPDEEDGYYADGESDEKPDAPAGWGLHILEGDEVLGGGDWGGCAAHVGG